MSTETEFTGAMSLDAILASVSGETKAPEAQPKKETPKAEDPKPKVPTPVTTEEKEDPIVATEKVVEVPVPHPTVDNNTETEAYKRAQFLMDNGMLEDFSIQISDDDEDGTPISEFKSMTDENLKEILAIYKQEKDTEITSKYISKDGLKEHQLKVIEILKNGGDLSKIADSPDKAFERPFEGFDMDDQKRQIDVRYTDLVHSKKLDHEAAITIIDQEVKSGKIQEKAQEIFDSYRQAHANYIDNKLEEQRKDKEFKELNFKENKKLLIAKLKESGLKDTVYKKVAAEYSKKNEEGQYALVDKLIEALNNPGDNYELILHLSDKKLFNDTYKIKSAQETQKQIVRLASGANSKGNRQTTTRETNTAIAPWMADAEKFNQKLKSTS